MFFGGGGDLFVLRVFSVTNVESEICSQMFRN